MTVRARSVGAVAAAIGAAVVLLSSAPIALDGSARSPLLLAFTLWALAPYALLVAIGWLTSNPWIVGGAGVTAITLECAIRAAVFIFPRGSTSAVALVFSPAFIALVAIPIGAAAGLAAGWMWRRDSALLRGVVVAAATTTLGLAFLGTARPDLFPTTVLRRRAAVERIGPPRIVAGADAFLLETVWREPAWYDAGPLSGTADDVIVVASSGDVRLLDPDGGRERRRMTLDPGGSRAWNWYSRLVRLGDRLVIVQTGGGFSDTQVVESDGRIAWRYQPSATLPPTALRAADLDGDGRVEFYASAQGIARLDEDGREIWRRPEPLVTLVALLPRSDRFPSWVVASRYADRVHVWNDSGEPIGTLKPDMDPVLTAVEWQDERLIVLGGHTLRALGLDGRERFRIPLGDFSAAETVVVRGRPGRDPLLAVSAGGPRDTSRWRLALFSPAREVVYDQIFDAPIRVFTARSADGHDTLFVAGNGLRALRPIR